MGAYMLHEGATRAIGGWPGLGTGYRGQQLLRMERVYRGLQRKGGGWRAAIGVYREAGRSCRGGYAVGFGAGRGLQGLERGHRAYGGYSGLGKLESSYKEGYRGLQAGTGAGEGL